MVENRPRVGVLALQGDFESHRKRLAELGASTVLVKRARDLEGLDGLAMPGGESSAMLKLLGDEFYYELGQALRRGLPTLATCAGIILLAKHVSNPEQRSLGVIDIDVVRNAYGRQIDSFITDLPWTETGRALSAQISGAHESESIEAVFIRAPKISRVGSDVEVLVEHAGEPVLVKQGRSIAATFHPELSSRANVVHQLFLNSLRDPLEN